MVSYRDWVVETSSTTGTGTYNLSGSAPAGTSYFTFRQRFSNGEDEVVYWVVNADRTKWEKNRFGTLTYGTPDTLTRNVVESTNGDAPVSWVGGDLPLKLYVVQDADAAEFAISMGLGAARPGILKFGLWADLDDVSSGIHSLKLFDGVDDITLGSIDTAAHSFILSAGVSGWRQLGTANPNAASAVDFINIPADINHLMIVGQCKLNTNNVGLGIQTYGADGVLDTGASDYSWSNWNADTSGATGIIFDSADSQIIIANSASSTGNAAPSFVVHAANIQAAHFTSFNYRTFWLNQAGVVAVSNAGGGSRNETDRITGVRFLSSSGTLGAGIDEIRLYGAP